MQKKLLFLPFLFSLFSILFAGAPDTLWTRTYGGEDFDRGYSVQQTSDGGFIITGSTRSFGAGKDDVYLIRTNSDGDTLWTKTYGGADVDEGWSVQLTSDGGFIIAGFSDSFGGVGRGVFLIYTDEKGDTLWTRTYYGNLNASGFSVRQISDGGFVVSGMTGTMIEAKCFLVRTNPNGDTVWTKTYGGTMFETIEAANSVIQTSDNGFFLACAHENNVYLVRANSNGDTLWTKSYGGEYYDEGRSALNSNDGGFVILGSSHNNAYLIKTDLNGDTLWTKKYGGAEYSYGRSISKAGDDGYIITGQIGYSENCDFYIIRTNLEGDTIWTKRCGRSFEEQGWSVQQTTDGGFVVAGTINYLDSGDIDVLLIRLDKETIGIQDDNNNFFLKPNNFIISSSRGNISIRYTLPYSSHIKLEAFDIQGRLVEKIQDRFMHKGSYRVTWDSKRFGAGVFYVKLSLGEENLVRKAIILK